MEHVPYMGLFTASRFSFILNKFILFLANELVSLIVFKAAKTTLNIIQKHDKIFKIIKEKEFATHEKDY